MSYTKINQVLDHPDFETLEYILIDEGQFFEDLYESVIDIVENHKKHVYIGALDGTWERKPFQHVVDLIPFSDSITKLYATCSICNAQASFSKRIVESKETNLIGSTESYLPMCRKHFNYL
jgi:thymidine kinase